MESFRIGQTHAFINQGSHHGSVKYASPVLDLICYPDDRRGFVYRAKGVVFGQPGCASNILSTDVLVPEACLGTPVERSMVANMLRKFADAFERGDTEDPKDTIAKLKDQAKRDKEQILGQAKQLEEVRKAVKA